MKYRVDREFRQSLLESLERLKAYSVQYEARKEKRLWREIEVPCSLSVIIGGLYKEEMNNIRKSYGFSGTSSLRKAELAAQLVELVPARYDKMLSTLDQERYDLLKAVVNNSGLLKAPDISTSQAKNLLNSCLLFPGTVNNERVLYMPPELKDVFLRSDGAALGNMVKRNTEWILLTHGMLYYYGVMGLNTLLEKIGQLTGSSVGFIKYTEVIIPAVEYYGQVCFSASGLCDSRVHDAEELVNEHKSRQINYYPFTREQLLKAGTPGFFERTADTDTFLSFLEEHYDLNDAEKDNIALKLIGIINKGEKLNDIIKYLGSRLEFPSFDFMQLVTEKAVEFYNNTRQWALKGHTPNELFQEEKKFLKPLPAGPFLMKEKEKKVSENKTRKKTGHNDPCPCGSGKKFKKCCGR